MSLVASQLPLCRKASQRRIWSGAAHSAHRGGRVTGGPFCWSLVVASFANLAQAAHDFLVATLLAESHQATKQMTAAKPTSQRSHDILGKKAAEYVCVYVSIYLSIYRSIYLFIDLSIYRSIDLSIYLSIYLCIYVSMYLCIYVSMYLCTYVRMNACMHASMHACMHVCMCIYTYVCVYIYRLSLLGGPYRFTVFCSNQH